MKIIPGEKQILRREINLRESYLGRKLTDKEKYGLAKEIHKQVKKQEKKYIRKSKIKAILVGLGITTAAVGIGGAVKALPEAQKAKTETTSEMDKASEKDKNQEFRGRYEVAPEDLENYTSVYKQTEVEKEINKLESKEDLEAYIKNMWIEQYEKITGDTELTTDDIQIDIGRWQNYVSVNQETGDIITHGANPLETEEKLEADHIVCSTKENVKIYNILDKEGNIIDSVATRTENGKTVPVKVIPGDRYDEMKDYESISAQMGNIIPKGIEYCENCNCSDKDLREASKDAFIKAIEEAEQNEKQIGKDEGR